MSGAVNPLKALGYVCDCSMPSLAVMTGEGGVRKTKRSQTQGPYECASNF